MKLAGQLGLTGLAATAALGLTATAAAAATTTIHSGSATGPAYSGSVTASLLGTATVATSLGSGSCTSSTLTGSISSNGTGLNISSATFTGTGSGGACAGSGISATVTAQNLPWSGGSAVYSPVSGGKDANITIANFKVKAVVNILGGITCYYGGNLTAPGYNPNNPNKPVSSTHAETAINGASVSLASGSNFFCPGTATVTATYALTGAGGVDLYVTS